MRLEKVDKDEDGDAPRLVLGVLRRAGTRARDAAGLGAGLRGRGPPEGLGQGDPAWNGEFEHGRRYELVVHPRDPQSLGHPHRGGRAPGGRVLRPQAASCASPATASSCRPPRDRRLRFATLNLGRVHLEVKKVFADKPRGRSCRARACAGGRERPQLLPRLQRAPRRRGRRPRQPCGSPTSANSWLEHELDLGALIAEGGPGDLPGGAALRPGGHALPARRRRRGDPPATTTSGADCRRGRDYYSDPTVRGLRPRPRPGGQGP